MRAVCSSPATPKLVVTVIAHAHRIHWEVSVLTIGDLSLFTTRFPCSDSARLWANMRFRASSGGIRTQTACWTALSWLTSSNSAFFRADFGIWTKLYAVRAYAACGARFPLWSCFFSTLFLTDSRLRAYLDAIWTDASMRTWLNLSQFFDLILDDVLRFIHLHRLF